MPRRTLRGDVRRMLERETLKKQCYLFPADQNKVKYYLDNEIETLSAVPDNAELVAEAAYVTAADGTLLMVEVYAAPEVFRQRAACCAAADSILDSVATGGRRLEFSPRRVRLDDMELQTVQDYYLYEQPDVVFGMMRSWQLVKVVPAGAPAPCLFLAKALQGGGETDFTDSREQKKNIEETVLGQPAFWYCRIRDG